MAEVAINKLLVTDSPRLSGQSAEHVATLAAVETELPPIIVHRETMAVIDGLHRLRVAQLRGHQMIRVNRLRRGDDPLAMRREDRRGSRGEQFDEPRREYGEHSVRLTASGQQQAALIERLRADPALRLSESGRGLLRLLYIHMVRSDEWEKIAAAVPPYCSETVASLARECAEKWMIFAELVESDMAAIP